MTTSLKCVSSMKLHRGIGVTQKTAWYMLHRMRLAWETDGEVFHREVDADEPCVGGRKSNKHADKKLRAGWGKVGKTVVAGVKDRETNQVNAEVVNSADKATLQQFVTRNTTKDATVYTDGATAYNSLPCKRQSMPHSIGHYVDGRVHTNGIESFWATLKRGYKGEYHKMSRKHLNRYIVEFTWRYNNRWRDTSQQMAIFVKGNVNKQLKYAGLIA